MLFLFGFSHVHTCLKIVFNNLRYSRIPSTRKFISIVLLTAVSNRIVSFINYHKLGCSMYQCKDGISHKRQLQTHAVTLTLTERLTLKHLNLLTRHSIHLYSTFKSTWNYYYHFRKYLCNIRNCLHRLDCTWRYEWK